MIQDCGISWVIVGHSERRRLYGETDAIVGEKVVYALNHSLKVMACIGETLEQREAGKTLEARSACGGLACGVTIFPSWDVEFLGSARTGIVASVRSSSAHFAGRVAARGLA